MVRLEDLSPDKKYSYKLKIDGKPVKVEKASFSTPPAIGEPGKFAIGFGGGGGGWPAARPAGDCGCPRGGARLCRARRPACSGIAGFRPAIWAADLVYPLSGRRPDQPGCHGRDGCDPGAGGAAGAAGAGGAGAGGAAGGGGAGCMFFTS